MWSRILGLAAALVLAPLGARAADLVVWWEKGPYPEADKAVAEIVAAFEQETGKEVELVLHDQYEMFGQSASGARGGAPPDFSSASVTAPLGVGLRGPAGRSQGRPRPCLGSVRSRYS